MYLENRDLGASFISVYIKKPWARTNFSGFSVCFPVFVFIFSLSKFITPFSYKGSLTPNILSVFTYDQSPGCSQILFVTIASSPVLHNISTLLKALMAWGLTLGPSDISYWGSHHSAWVPVPHSGLPHLHVDTWR